MADTSVEAPVYPPKSNPVVNVLRTACAYSLLASQLVFFLFVLELPYWFADRFLARHRGDAFYRGQKRLARWFFRLYPFGQQRHVNVTKAAFPETCVIVCNHQSVLDILLALMLPVNARWMIKGWPFKVPLMGELNKLARHIKVEDAAIEDATEDVTAQAEPAAATATEPPAPKGFDTALDWLKDGVSILVFPEGSRSPDGRIRRFRNGAFKLAIDAQVPIVPVLFEGSGACVRKGSIVVHHPDVVIKVLEPVSTKGLADARDAAALKQRVHAQMQTELAALRAADKRPSFPRIHGWLTRLGMAGVALLILLAVGTSVYVNNWCIAEPPVYDGSRALAEEKMVERSIDGMPLQLLGENWRRKRHGVHELAISGNPWERGYANARLSQDLVEQQEKFLLAKANEFLPNRPSLWVAKQLVAINNRRLPDYLTEAEKLEILGLTDGSIDHFPDDAPLYHRIMNYHAAHDISHIFIDNPIVTKGEFVGCSAFAAWDEATNSGNLIIGRNFDFEAGPVFDDDKAIVYVWPDTGYAYVHVAWAGMAGAVTGMNEHGLSIHINAARTSEVGFGRIGTPVSMLVRRVLEQARTIDEAFTIIREAQVFVSDTYMVGSRHDGRAVVIEKSPHHCALREAARPGLILQTNHMLTEPLKDDKVNLEQIERATTTYRWQRLEELTDRHFGMINPGIAQTILRDRSGRGDKRIGLGNRNAIDAGICSHSVIMNVTTGEMWVSAAPHTFGTYVHVPVTTMLAAGPMNSLRVSHITQLNLARDPDAYAFENLHEYRKQLRLARGYIDSGEAAKAEPLIRSLRNLNPDFFETSYLEGRLSYQRGNFKAAARKFEDALDQDPHYEDVRETIRGWLARANAKSK